MLNQNYKILDDRKILQREPEIIKRELGETGGAYFLYKIKSNLLKRESLTCLVDNLIWELGYIEPIGNSEDAH